MLLCFLFFLNATEDQFRKSVTGGKFVTLAVSVTEHLPVISSIHIVSHLLKGTVSAVCGGLAGHQHIYIAARFVAEN